MKRKVALILGVAVCAALSGLSGVLLAEPVVIGGITPDRRPEGLPKIDATGFTVEGRQQALHGVIRPYPPSLKWLDDQGGWFTPFTHPGMTGPYDIRSWHETSDE